MMGTLCDCRSSGIRERRHQQQQVTGSVSAEFGSTLTAKAAPLLLAALLKLLWIPDHKF